MQKALSTGNLVTAYNGVWEAAQFGEQQFDLIICTHVLYFVPPENWGDFIRKMVSHIAPDGRILSYKDVVDETTGRREPVVVINWFDELEAKVPN